jgi:hypothetical protein
MVEMTEKPKFLDKVRVKQFAYNAKTYKGRELCLVKNLNPETVFYVIGTVNFPHGVTHWYPEEGTEFHQTGSTQVFIVANTIGIRYKATLEDLERIEA